MPKGKMGPRPGGHGPMGGGGGFGGRPGGFHRRPMMRPPMYGGYGYRRGCFPRLWGCLIPTLVALLVVGGVLIVVL